MSMALLWITQEAPEGLRLGLSFQWMGAGLTNFCFKGGFRKRQTSEWNSSRVSGQLNISRQRVSTRPCKEYRSSPIRNMFTTTSFLQIDGERMDGEILTANR